MNRPACRGAGAFRTALPEIRDPALQTLRNMNSFVHAKNTGDRRGAPGFHEAVYHDSIRLPMHQILDILSSSWRLLVESSIYILLGLLVSGLMKAFLDPNAVFRHLGHGRFLSVFKAALIGIPLPLCSCGVVPAALSLRQHGANTGATTAFMISTPESGVDSIAVTYALMDPIMTVARPLAAFVTAVAAGISENLIGYRAPAPPASPVGLRPGQGDGAPGGAAASAGRCRRLWHRIASGMGYAFTEFWGDLAGWFFAGILLAGAITALIPDEVFSRYFGPGLPSMLAMLVIGIPIYICATASTPIAAALILKGVSPGAALVFLLAGPATNIASLTMVFGILGRRAAAVYLAAIAVSTVGCGLLLDAIYGAWDVPARAMIGQAPELLPSWLELAGAVFLFVLSLRPMARWMQRAAGRIGRLRARSTEPPQDCGAT